VQLALRPGLAAIPSVRRLSIGWCVAVLTLTWAWALLAMALAGCSQSLDPILLLAPPTPMTGQVTGVVSNGLAPLNQAVVSLAPGDLATSTDATGTYTLSNLSPGTYTLRASAAGYSAASRDVTVLAGLVSGGDVTLDRSAGSGAVSGRVTDGLVAVAGVRIELRGAALTAVSAEDGTFQFSGVAPGLYEVVATRNGYRDGTAIVTVAAGQTGRVNLAIVRRADGSISGRVTDGLHGLASCSRQAVVVLYVNGQPVQRFVPLTQDCSSGLLSVTDRFRFDGLSTGPYVLQAMVSGFRAGTKTVNVLGGSDNNGDVVLTTDGTRGAVAGTIFDSTMLAVAGAQITLSSGATQTTTQSGSDGRYVLFGLTPGAATLTASRTGQGSGSVNVTLAGGDTADGTVVLAR
jgi:hypothetical protein